MHIVAQEAMQQDLVHITCSMVSTPCLPIDVEFGVMTPDLNEVVTSKYVKKSYREDWNMPSKKW